MTKFTFFLTVIALSSLTFLSCKQGGCTDKSALNYDDDAKNDDGSCEYLVSSFLGTWSASDTTFMTPKGGSTTKTVKNYTFSAKKKTGTDLFLNGFSNCKDTLWGVAAEDRFNVGNGSLCVITSILFLKENKSLTYTYLPTNAPVDTKVEVRGRATRQ
jgi:hypothetical protein